MNQIFASLLFEPLIFGVFDLKSFIKLYFFFVGHIPFQKRFLLLISPFYFLKSLETSFTSSVQLLNDLSSFAFHFHREHPLSNSTCIPPHHSTYQPKHLSCLLHYITYLSGISFLMVWPNSFFYTSKSLQLLIQRLLLSDIHFSFLTILYWLFFYQMQRCRLYDSNESVAFCYKI